MKGNKQAIGTITENRSLEDQVKEAGRTPRVLLYLRTFLEGITAFGEAQTELDRPLAATRNRSFPQYLWKPWTELQSARLERS